MLEDEQLQLRFAITTLYHHLRTRAFLAGPSGGEDSGMEPLVHNILDHVGALRQEPSQYKDLQQEEVTFQQSLRAETCIGDPFHGQSIYDVSELKAVRSHLLYTPPIMHSFQLTPPTDISLPSLLDNKTQLEIHPHKLTPAQLITNEQQWTTGYMGDSDCTYFAGGETSTDMETEATAGMPYAFWDSLLFSQGTFASDFMYGLEVT